MKNGVTTLDIVVLIRELREKLVGLRFDQLYDIDKKTYLIRLSKTNTKRTLLVESGARFHTTSFEWPKNAAPSGFTMKLRKHLNNKRLESIRQIGADRVVDFQFGTEAFAVHLLLELYDKGNIVLTDQDYNILSLVRRHGKGEDRVMTHEKYAIDKAKQSFSLTHAEMVSLVLENAGKTIRQVFLPQVEFGSALFTHVLREVGLSLQVKVPAGDADGNGEFQEKLFAALETGRQILEAPENLEPGGFIVTKQQTGPAASKGKDKEHIPNESTSTPAFVIYDQYQPMILASDFQSESLQAYPGLDEALDEFYSKLEAQKLDMRQLNQEREAYKKLDRVRDDQRHRLQELKLVQEVDRRKAELIIAHQSLVDSAIGILRSLVANQIPWDDIAAQIKEATARGDPIASQITGLQLLKNQFTMRLKSEADDEEEENGAPPRKDKDQGLDVQLDLDLSAYANAARFFDLKKASAKKEERTLESQTKAFKSTERKTLSSLREVATMQSIKRARKVYWFEKFHWFVSSENYVVLGGHDAQQNELLVKRYMGPYDVYLHADTHGAPTVIVKTGLKSDATGPAPKTLHEAGTLAVCASGSWESKIISTCWWVWGHQVSKSAPTGEYLPTGSFMIRGRKNYLPPCQLILGFGFLFRVTDECVASHRGERSVRGQGRAPSEKTSESEAEPEPEPEDMPPMSSDTESDSDAEGDCEAGTEEFPDTQIPVILPSAGTGRSRTISAMSSEYSMSTVTTALSGTDLEGGDGGENYTIVQSGVLPQFSADATSKQKQRQKGGGAGKKSAQQQSASKGKAKVQAPPGVADLEERGGPENNANANSNTSANAKPKRGQHGRQKKLKEKYKFQDDDEREMRMQLLQSKGRPQPAEHPKMTTGSGKTTVKKENQTVQNPEDEEKCATDQKQPLPRSVKPNPEKPDETSAAAEVEPEPEPEPLEIDVLDSLTGCPLEQDELLFAIPVIAPYSALQNYKYRIKLIPGTTKRGKAAKYAMELFVRDKAARPRERDLIKSVKDQDTARNFPGKVKLAAGAVDHKKK